MRVRINGGLREVREGLTLRELLAELGLAGEELLIELNGTILCREADPAAVILREGDALELVRFVGGG